MLETLRFTVLIRQLLQLRKYRADEVLALQQNRFRRLLHYAVDYSPFYREHFHGIDVVHCALTDLPVLTKEQMMANFDDVVTDQNIKKKELERFIAEPTNLGKYYLGRYAVVHTSGTEGQPALVVQTWKDVMRGFAVQFARGHSTPKHLALLLPMLWQPTRLAVVTQRPGFYPSGGAFTYLQNSRLMFLRLLRLSVFEPAEQTVQQLNTFQPHYLCGYTSSLETLAHQERAGRLKLRQSGALKQLTNLSEAMPPTSRTFIEETFGVHISDQYSMAECYALTAGCNLKDGCHVNADLALLEVVDDGNCPVPPGTPGSKVLLTNLYNRVQPLIRYEVRDVVTLSATSCPCGSNLPRIDSIAGRTKERLWLQVGDTYREIPYYLFLAGLHHCLDLAEHQVVQTGRNRFVVRVAPLPGKSLSGERVRQVVYDSVRAEGLADGINIDVEIVNEIKPDPRSGKHERVKNLVGPPAGVTQG